MKLVDLLIMRSKNEELPKEIVVKNESCSIKKKINEIIDYINKGEDK